MIFQMRASLALLLGLFALPISATELILTPFLGASIGGEVEDHSGKSYELETSEHFAVSLETAMDQGRVGFYLSTQNATPDGVREDVTIHYLQFQSSVVYPTKGALSSYVGIGVGGSYVDAAWVDDNVGFSASAFGGVEYKLSDAVSLNAQLRWMGTSVDNNSSGACVIASGQQNCTIRFDSEWMNQLQSNIGITIRF